MLPSLALGLLVAVAFWQREVGPRWDFARVAPGGSFTYVAMAVTPFWNSAAPYEAPYCWRLLGPLLLHVWPFDLSLGFFCLSALSLFGTTLAVVWLLSGLNLPARSASGGGVAFVLLGAGAAYNLHHYNLIDPLAFLFLALVLAALANRRGPVVAASLVLLAVTKETVLIAIITSVIWAAFARDHMLRLWVAAGSVLSFLLLEAIRLGVPASTHYSLFREFTSIYVPLPRLPDLWRIAIGASGLTWGILLPIAALQLVHAPRVWRNPALTMLISLATAQILVASDTERVVIVGFPAMIAATAFEVEYLAVHFLANATWLWTVICVAEIPWLLGSLEARGIPYLTVASSLMVLLSVGLPAAAYARQRAGSRLE